MIKRLKYYKKCFIEVIELLCTVCLYLEEQAYRNHSKYSHYFKSHFVILKTYSNKIRGTN